MLHPLPHPTKAMRTLCTQERAKRLVEKRLRRGEKMATPKSARCYSNLFVGIAIDPFHAQEAQQTCWVEKEKCESARQATISDGCFS